MPDTNQDYVTLRFSAASLVLGQQGASALSDAELLTIITGVLCLETAQRLLIAAGGLRGLLTLSTVEQQQLVAGISVGRAA